MKYLHDECEPPIIHAKGIASTVKGSPYTDTSDLFQRHLRHVVGYKPKLTLLDRVLFQLGPKKGLAARKWLRLAKSLDDTIYQRLCKRYVRNIEAIVGDRNLDEAAAATLTFLRTRNKNHDMKKVLNWMSGNMFIVSPFVDTLVSELEYNPFHDDRLLLGTLIFDRYDPELLEVGFEGRTLKPSTVERAKQLNERFPVSRRSYAPLTAPRHEVHRTTVNEQAMTSYLEGIWSSEDFEKTLDSCMRPGFAKEAVSSICRDYFDIRTHPINALMAIYEFQKMTMDA